MARKEYLNGFRERKVFKNGLVNLEKGPRRVLQTTKSNIRLLIEGRNCKN